MKDPIVEELRAVREEHAARHGHDLRRIYSDLKKKERRYSRRLVRGSPRVLLGATGS